jgi:DNA polymerase I-like protein with 3'-5' exonuclease and polymerase domains
VSEWQPPSDLPDLRRAGIIAIDTETRDDGLSAGRGPGWAWGGGYIVGVSVAWRAAGEIRAIYISLRHPDSANFDREQVIRWLRDLLASGVRVVTHNGLYDYGWLRADFGLTMPPAERIEETLALASIVDENRHDYSLDALCAWRGLPGKDETLLRESCRMLGLVPKRIKKFKPQAFIWQMPAHLVGPYVEQDTRSTLLLYESLNPVLDQEGTRAAYRLECGLLPMVHEMRRRGIRIDRTAAHRAQAVLRPRRDAALAQIGELLGAPVTMKNIRGRNWLVATFDRLGITYPRTKKGNPSFKRKKVGGWMRQSTHPLPPLIADACDLDNYAENFIGTQILGHVRDGRVFAEINPHRGEAGGTHSFRFSYAHPPLQQMPKHDEKLAPLVRAIFLPEDGEVWASCDISQQEFRLIVHYAVQHKLPRADEAAARYRDDPDTDFHLLVAEWTGIERQLAKNANFARSYGAGVKKFAEMIGKPEAEARAIWSKYDRELPFVSRLSEHCQQLVWRQGYLTLYGGARRHFNRWAPGGEWEKGAGPCEHEEAVRRTRNPAHPWYRKPLYRIDVRNAMNALIQGSAAYHTKLWMRDCYRAGIVPLLQMHDALELSVRAPEQPALAAKLGCSVVADLAVPMKVDVKYGRTWGDAKHTWAELHETKPPAETEKESSVSEQGALALMLEPPAWAAGLPLSGKVHSGPLYLDAPATAEPPAPKDEIEHAREESHAETNTHAEPVEELLDVRARAPREAPKFVNDFDSAPDSAPADDIVIAVLNELPATPSTDNKTVELPREGTPIFPAVPHVSAPAPALAHIGDGFDSFPENNYPVGKILCPFHQEKTPSCHLYADGHYHCYGCGEYGWIDEDFDLDDATLAKLARSASQDDTNTLERGLALWNESKSIAGTLAARYLTDTRKLDLTMLSNNVDAVLRFHSHCPFGANGARHPCLLALFRDVETDAPAGIHRIGLTKNADKIKRLTLGRWSSPRAIKLWPLTHKLTIGEGIETVLGAIRCGAITPPAWAMGPKTDIANFPVLPGVKALTVLVDRGDPAALDGAEMCTTRYASAGIPARWLRTVKVKDFNDLVLS